MKIKPNNADTLNNLGNVMAMKGFDEEAVALYQKALESQPSYGPPPTWAISSSSITDSMKPLPNTATP